MSSYKLGIDVGGTNTDAVILDSTDVPVAKTKTPRTENISSGIVDAFDDVLEESGIETSNIHSVMLSTTHATNAIAERQGLNEVGIIRIGSPATESIRPLLEWPNDLAAAIGNNVAILDGGHEFNGETLNELDESQVQEQINAFEHVDAFAVTSVFSPARADHEERVAKLIRDEVGEKIPVSLSHEIGSVGLLERENATALNAALTSVAAEAANAFIDAIDEREIDARLYFGQNDGTLMNVEYALDYPIFTVASGPSNSIRGAAFLSDIGDGIVVDVGGTTTDIGALANGFPRESSVAVEVGDVKTNFRMPDLISIAIGGGSHVNKTNKGVTVGPESVGYQLPEEALSFGGATMTATDIEVAAGTVDIGTETPDLNSETLNEAREYIRNEVEQAVDRMKTNPKPVPVVVAGGGSILIPDDLSGASEVHKPDHFEVANAVGVAIAQVAGEVDSIYSLDEQSREEALEDARAEAAEKAIEAGSNPDTIEIVDVEEVPLSYLPGNAVRIKVKMAGDLQH